jgi:hypothetical protein
MNQTNISRRPIRLVRGLFGVLLTLSAACNGGPTAPSNDDLIRMYSGRWRGNINNLEVVLDVRASDPSFGITFLGTGTARSATGEIHRLRIDGGTLLGGGFTPRFAILVELEGTGPGVVTVTSGAFEGDVSPDGRTWPGRFTSDPNKGAAVIFGPGEHSVTLTKE